MDVAAIRHRVRELALANAPHDSRSAGPGSRLVADLDYDSLALASLAVDIQEEFELPAISYDWPDEMTIEALEEHVLRLMGDPAR